jgi:L-aminopeptidase/D-esterase-like protein
VGKILGIERAVKSGIGSAAIDLGRGLLVAALVAVNAFGDVIDPQTGQIVAGARHAASASPETGSPFAGTLQVMKVQPRRRSLRFARRENTVIGVVATNARLNKEQANKVAQMAHAGLARAVRPASTMLDGDTLFCLATGQRQADVNLVGAYAAEAVAQAILRAVTSARSAGGLPAIHDFRGER